MQRTCFLGAVVLALAGTGAVRAETGTERTDGARARAARVPPPITVLPMFTWVVEGDAPNVRRWELSIFSSGVVVYSVAYKRDGADAGRVPVDEFTRRTLPRPAIAQLLKTIERERLADYPERFTTRGARTSLQPVVRATLRTPDRTVSVTCETSSTDRSLRAAPAGWAEIEKRVLDLLARVRAVK